MIGFPLLAMLPDVDVLPHAFGAVDRGLFGHRGLTHTPMFALGAGVAVWLWLWLWHRLRPRARARAAGGPVEEPVARAMRLALAAAVAGTVASHGILDALAQHGRGVLFLWPLSTARFHFPWRPIPDCPVGQALFSRAGARRQALELVYFLPLVFYALGPRRWRSAHGAALAQPRPAAPFDVVVE